MSSRLHPFARLVVAALGLLVLLSLTMLVLLLGYGIYLAMRTPGQNGDQILGSVTQWANSNALTLTLISYPVGVLWLGFCRSKWDKRSFVSLGLRRPRALPNALRGVVAGFLSIAVVWAILWLTGGIAVNGWSDAARQAGVWAIFPLLGWALAFAAVGFFEELVFRGYALHNLISWLNWKWAVLIQATLFALIHLGNVAVAPREAQLTALGAMPSIFLIGVFFALCYRKTGSLWFPIGFHMAWDFSLGCLFSQPVSGIKTFQLLSVQSPSQGWLSGGAFGTEGSFFLIPIIFALIWLILQAPDHPQAMLDLELSPAPIAASPTIAAPIETTEVADSSEAEPTQVEPERKNRYGTKFGTSEGFDEEMLRELRELQGQRERAEAETRRQQTAQTAVVEIELLKPPVVEEIAQETAEEVAAAEPLAAEPVVTEPAIAEVEAPEIKAKPVEIEKKVVPVEAETVEEAEVKPAEIKREPAPLPVPVKKKALPKW